MSSEIAQPLLGIIGSSGGACLKAAAQCLKQAGIDQRWAVLTDRNCGLSDWATSESAVSRILPYQGVHHFSAHAQDFFSKLGVNKILLFYTRKIGAPLIDAFEVCNIHPSLLPAFPGLGALRRAVSTNPKALGSTLHFVDENLDTGKIIMQVSSPFQTNSSITAAERISYLQKIWLTLYWQNGMVRTSPYLQDQVEIEFERYRDELGFHLPICAELHRCA
ncbi:formyltransferase family protein [Dokdonella sp.]|uniref:formyltransferase family protein n=1 Tax=Dokdonella sp. TaxID=2291710 RepID=UPI0035276C2B